MKIISVNIGRSEPLTVKHREVQTGIHKKPVSGAVPVGRFGLQDDVRIEDRKMGLEHNAVYAYPVEHYDYWQKQLECKPFPMGHFGENLTISGLLETEARIGDILRFGSAVLQIAHPRIPCAKLNAHMGFRFSTTFLSSTRVGYYLRVIEEGQVSENDPIELLERDENSPTMETFVRVAHYEYWDAEALRELLQARDLMPGWKESIELKLDRAMNARGWHGLREFEIVAQSNEDENSVLIDLKCARRKKLAAFEKGQEIMVVLGGRGANQQRQTYPLAGETDDMTRYRIRVSRHAGSSQGKSVSKQLIDLPVGSKILCNAPGG